MTATAPEWQVMRTPFSLKSVTVFAERRCREEAATARRIVWDTLHSRRRSQRHVVVLLLVVLSAGTIFDGNCLRPLVNGSKVSSSVGSTNPERQRRQEAAVATRCLPPPPPPRAVVGRPNRDDAAGRPYGSPSTKTGRQMRVLRALGSCRRRRVAAVSTFAPLVRYRTLAEVLTDSHLEPSPQQFRV
jgi:hypothetical protein